MPTNWAPKQQAFTRRFSDEVVAFLAAADTLTVTCTEFTDDGYGVGGANQLTDEVVQAVLPHATAASVAGAHGALAGADQVLDAIAAVRGYLEMMRP